MYKQLSQIRETGQGSVTYIFADGTKQVSNINSQIFYDEKGRKKDLNAVVNVFQTTAHDLKAISFEF